MRERIAAVTVPSVGVLHVLDICVGAEFPRDDVAAFVIVKGIAPHVPMPTIFRGNWPFWFTMLVAIILILIMPEIARYLPNSMLC